MPLDPSRNTVAVILAGGVARGAFEAGVLKVLADSGVRIVRIVATSSGALNGAFLASAIRGRRAREGAQRLVELWREHSSWADIFHCNPLELLGRRGISDTTKLQALLQRRIRPVQVADPDPINLRIIVSPVEGVLGAIDGYPATTYEQMLEFDGVDFDSCAGVERVISAAAASSSLPILFTPTAMPGLGDCVDGGAVNNNPIGYASDGPLGEQIDAVIMISPTVALKRCSTHGLHGARLAGHLVEMLINERLYRDLRHHEQIKAVGARLDALSPEVLDAQQLAAVRQVLGWTCTQTLEIVPIRPLDPLPGTAFSGLFNAAERETYIEVGIDRARQVLRERGWL
jgi:NTE family protein